MKKINIIDIDTYVKQVYNSNEFSFYGDYSGILSDVLNMGGGSPTGGKTSFNLDFFRDICIENDVNVTIGNTDLINEDERKPFKLKRK